MAEQVPVRQVRARFNDHSVTVYQAYPPEIAEPALREGTFVAPFRLERMTWIKPSFRWMLYRCGWAGKAGQERVVAVDITRAGFEWALAHAWLTHYDPGVHSGREQWASGKDAAEVRVQWDPERSLRFDPLGHRSIQIGLSGEAVRHYLDEWIVDISDVTSLARQIGQLVEADRLDDAADLLPVEQPYPLSTELRSAVGAS